MESKRMARYITFALTELAWGAVFALFLQHTRPGRYLARCRAWLAVVIGVGGTQALALQVVPKRTLFKTSLAFVLSAVGIVARALINEQRLERVLSDAPK